jgi:hypothetical protein
MALANKVKENKIDKREQKNYGTRVNIMFNWEKQ